MSNYVHFDYETSSFIDIAKLGGYRYACDDSTQILMFAIAGEEGRPVVWDFLEPDSEESCKARKLLKGAVKRETLLYAWNAPFEHAVSRYKLKDQVGVAAPNIDNYRCVAAMARRAALPNALGKCAEALQMDQKKAKVGSLLIKCFSDRTKLVTLRPPPGAKDYTLSTRGRKPANRKSDSPIHGWQDSKGNHHGEILWDWLTTIGGEDLTVREAWDLFKEYCRQDVVVERDIHKTLHRFELEGQILESFQFNMRMNDRGIPLNKEALTTAIGIINQYQERMKRRFEKLTGFRPTQGQALLPWLRDRGYLFDNLQAETVVKALSPALVGDLKPDAKRALEMLQLVGFAALKKVPAMLGAMCPDNRVRGTMMWSVARTGRAGGRIVQPQNMKKATMETCLAFAMLCEGCTLEDIEEFWDSPLEVIACCVRHFIQHPSKKFFDADYTGVEARITPWLAGNQRKLDSVLQGEDQYLQAASMAFSIPYESLYQDYKFGEGQVRELASKRRTIGKPIELSCCFGTGARGLRNSLRDLYGVKLPLSECKAIVKKYRDENPETVDAWNEIEVAFIAAIKGQTSLILNGKVKIGRVVTAGIAYVVLKLPSGRNLYYPRAHTKRVFKKFDLEELEEEPWKKSDDNWDEQAKAYGYWADEIRFWGSKDGKPFSWVPTWGSRLFENCLTPDTEVLTQDGWLPITEVGERKVSDGVEWVCHSGLKESWADNVIRVDGLGITTNHLVLTNKGWVKAKDLDPKDAYEHYEQTCSGTTMEHQGHHGPCGGEPHSFRTSATKRAQKALLEMPLQVRGGSRKKDIGANSEAQLPEQVYDLLNCGPRNRFVVRAPGGLPMVVHNCVQSIGADLLDRGCIEAERQGHEIFMVVHDQALCEENEHGLDHFIRAFTTKDDWAESFPLDAEGNTVNYYLKD